MSHDYAIAFQFDIYVVHLLYHHGKTSSFIKNSTEFAAFISDQTITDDTVLVSFDVISFFTNIPVDLACCMGSGCTASWRWVTWLTYHLITISSNRTPKVLLGCYLCSLQSRMVPADSRHCHGFPSVSDDGEPCHRRCWRESPCMIPHPTTLLEMYTRMLGYHSQPPGEFPQPPLSP